MKFLMYPDGKVKNGALLAHVRIGRDDEGRWHTFGGNVHGLVLQGPSFDELLEKICTCAPPLLKTNVPYKQYDGLLIDLVVEFVP